MGDHEEVMVGESGGVACRLGIVASHIIKWESRSQPTSGTFDGL